MANNRSLKDRPVKNIDLKILQTPGEMEKLFQWIDTSVRSLDQRRLSQLTAVEAGATDSDTIQNILTFINNLVSSMNESDFTENS